MAGLREGAPWEGALRRGGSFAKTRMGMGDSRFSNQPPKSMPKIQRALLSVTDKTGIVDFGRRLVEIDV